MIKAVISDLDGTLYRCDRYDSEVKEKTMDIIMDHLDIKRKQASILLNEAKKTYITLTKSIDSIGISRHIFYEELSRRLDYSRLLVPDTRINELIDKTHEIGCKFAIVTNSGRIHACNTMRALGISINFLDVFITSSEVEPKISIQPYSKALEMLQCTANEVLCVGDRVDVDLKPAKELGMYTVLVSKNQIESPWVDFKIESPFLLPVILKILMTLKV